MWFGCRKRHCGVLVLTKCTRKFAMVRSSVLKLPLTPESASTCTRCCLPTWCFAIRPTTNAGEGVWTSATPSPDSLASGVYFPHFTGPSRRGPHTRAGHKQLQAGRVSARDLGEQYGPGCSCDRTALYIRSTPASPSSHNTHPRLTQTDQQRHSPRARPAPHRRRLPASFPARPRRRCRQRRRAGRLRRWATQRGTPS